MNTVIILLAAVLLVGHLAQGRVLSTSSVIGSRRKSVRYANVLSNLSNRLKSIWQRALKQSFYEQAVEDENVLHKFDEHLVRRLIVAPLSEKFDPNAASALRGKIQYGDKCSLPSSIGKYIMDRHVEAPWLFELSPVRNVSYEFVPPRMTSCDNSAAQGSTLLTKAYISPLDFRSPENYIFLPQWLMDDLGLAVNDLVDISFVRIKLASLIVLQPISAEWNELIASHSDPKAMLEHELNKYSSLTAKSTIRLKIQDKVCHFYVKETQAEGGVSVHGVRIQDADVHTDIDCSLLADANSTTSSTEDISS